MINCLKVLKIMTSACRIFSPGHGAPENFKFLGRGGIETITRVAEQRSHRSPIPTTKVLLSENIDW